MYHPQPSILSLIDYSLILILLIVHSGIRRHLNPLLCGLLELRKDHLWTFDDFFREAHRVVRKVTFYVFDVTHGELVDLHLDPDDW